MADIKSAGNIYTQYYKIACVKSVTYSIFTSKEPTPDQLLLELELQIRHTYPRILLTYYNKCLFYFRFDHWKDTSEDNASNLCDDSASLALDQLYPQLTLKQENSASSEEMANPTRASKFSASKSDQKDSNLTDDLLAFASLSFLKAVKKALVYNLSAQEQIQLFGNYVIKRVEGTSSQYGIVQVDPVLLPNGDLIVSLTQRNNLPLFHSSILDLGHLSSDFASCFVIYVIPSGLRCHLHNMGDISQSFTTVSPSSSENLLRLLKLSTGIDLTRKESILWVKLVPNLQHLNNQTSKISRFIHDVDNKKYILWPWELCILQFGSVERHKITEPSASSIDPISLIDDFISNSIHEHESTTKNNSGSSEVATAEIGYHNPGTTNYPLSLSSGQSTVLSAVETDIKPSRETFGDQNPTVSDIFDLQTDMSYHINGNQAQELASIDKTEATSDMGSAKKDAMDDKKNRNEVESFDKETVSNDENNDEELFGASSDSESQDIQNERFSKLENAVTNEGDINPDFKDDYSRNKYAAANELLLIGDNLANAELESSNEKTPSVLQIGSEKKYKEMTYLGIPRNEMISATTSTTTPGSYKDPGAPPAIIPTPALPQATTFNPFNPRISSRNIQHKQESDSNNVKKEGKSKDTFSDGGTGWAFSPLVFNPKIKNNIDRKYGKGGKFYVDREESLGPEPDGKKSKLRETSVVPFERNQAHDTETIGTKKFSQEQTQDTVKAINNASQNKQIIGSEMVSRTSDPERPHDEMKADSTSSESDQETPVESDDMEEDEDESDEDEVSEVSTGSPMKLDSQHVDDIFNSSTNLGSYPENQKPNGSTPTVLRSFAFSNNAQNSPTSGINKTSILQRGDSPFGLGLSNIDNHIVSFSPIPSVEPKGEHELKFMNDEMKVKDTDAKKQDLTEVGNTSIPTASLSKDVSESSNCLPLLLRNINVSSIPNIFLLKRSTGPWNAVSMASGFDMDVDADEEDDDLDYKHNGLSVKSKNIDELLKWLMSNLVFDLGTTDFDSHTQYKLPDFLAEDVVKDVTDGGPSEDLANAFSLAFPLCYKISLSEFTTMSGSRDMKTAESQRELKNQLSFLSEITNENLSSNESQQQFQWDSIYPNCSSNRENFVKYRNNFRQGALLENKISDESPVFILNEVKSRVCKNASDMINLNFVGTRFWKYFNFRPVNGPKRFQVSLLTENRLNFNPTTFSNFDVTCFLDLLKANYAENHLGSIKKLNLQSSESRPELEGISNGLILVDKDAGDPSYNEFYKKVNKRLKNLAELIKLDLINRTNKFEFDRPLLLLFVNFDESANSVLQISKVCRNFQIFLNDHQLALVEVFTHVISWSTITKQTTSHRRLKYMSNLKLAKTTMTLYNKCPNPRPHSKPGMIVQNEPKKLYTQLVMEPPSSLRFKFMTKSNKEGTNFAYHDDLFLHVAYERSIDKNWISAAWSDPLGVVTHIRTWYCSLGTQSTQSKDAHDLGSIITELWETSNMLFKKLNEELSQKTCGSGRKKFLVLTRISSIIPDDELIFWKQLTTKYKEVSLIVLSTNRLPKYLFNSENESENSSSSSPKHGSGLYEKPTNGDNEKKHEEQVEGSDFMKTMGTFSGVPNSNSPSGGIQGLGTSPINNSMSFYSPPQFLNATSNLLSPQDAFASMGTNDPDIVLKDPGYDVIGVIPNTSLPSFNAPTRLGMRIGYLIKEKAPAKVNGLEYMVFEVTLLSCSAYWNLNSVMKILLNQYKKLIVLNEILGTCDHDTSNQDARSSREAELKSLVPWHINAVVKTLNYIVHVSVED